MKSFISFFTLCSLIIGVYATTGPVAVGSTYKEVWEALGEPNVESGNDKHRIMMYDIGTFILTNNVVAECEYYEPKKVKKKTPRPSPSGKSSTAKLKQAQYRQQILEAQKHKLLSQYKSWVTKYGERAGGAIFVSYAYGCIFGQPIPVNEYEYQRHEAMQLSSRQALIAGFERDVKNLGKNTATEKMEDTAYYRKLVFDGYSPKQASSKVRDRVKGRESARRLKAAKEALEFAQMEAENARIDLDILKAEHGIP